MSLHNDEPVLADALGRMALVREVGDVIADCKPPQVLGVHGDWGLGKTSFMHQVQFYLTGKCPLFDDEEVKAAKTALPEAGRRYSKKVCVVWFEAWRYQHETAPVVALLQEIRSQLAWHLKFVKQAQKLSEVAVRSALLSLDSISKLIGFELGKVAATAQSEGEKWEKNHLAEVLPSNVLREQLAAAIEGLLKPIAEETKHPRVVVMIDDLDRCDPVGAFRLLEGLKVFLTLPNCIFLLGMNEQIMEDGIGKQIPISDKCSDPERVRSERASAYLEKLCQNMWRLPAVAEPKPYLLSLLPETDVLLKECVEKAIGDHRCLPPNPRRLKGLANLIARFASRCLPTANENPAMTDLVRQTRLMLIVAYVYQFHHDLFRIWETNPDVHRHLLSWARGRPLELAAAEMVSEKEEEKAMLLPVLLKRLRRSVFIRIDEKSPTPLPPTVLTAYPDPADTSVFWMQPLIDQAARESVGGHSLEELYRPFLKGFRDLPKKVQP